MQFKIKNIAAVLTTAAMLATAAQAATPDYVLDGLTVKTKANFTVDEPDFFPFEAGEAVSAFFTIASKNTGQSGSTFSGSLGNNWGDSVITITNGSSSVQYDAQLQLSSLAGLSNAILFARIGDPNDGFFFEDPDCDTDSFGLDLSAGELLSCLETGHNTSFFSADFDLPFNGGTIAGESGFNLTRVSPIPLPAGLPLLVAGLGGLAIVRRRAGARQ